MKGCIYTIYTVAGKNMLGKGNVLINLGNFCIPPLPDFCFKGNLKKENVYFFKLSFSFSRQFVYHVNFF